MSKIERREKKLMELLQTYRRLEISQVADWLEVSETTARRMCTKLESTKKVIRVHGGVQLSEQYINDYSYHNKELHNLHEKVAIGNYCASLIKSGERIFCDSGTTIHQFVLGLVNRIKAGEVGDIVILSNSLANFDPIANYCKVILLGGEVRLSRLDVCGSVAEEVLKKFHITKAFLGADAISTNKGFMTTDERTSQLNEIVLSDAETSYVLVDSSKFDKSSFISYAVPEMIDEVVTDWNLDAAIKTKFEQLGYTIKAVEESDNRF
jgi:DeoR family transcriptional regulator, fructose operon transcriptional repressor